MERPDILCFTSGLITMPWRLLFKFTYKRHPKKACSSCDIQFNLALLSPKLQGLITYKRKSLDANLRFIAKKNSQLFDFLLYVPLNRQRLDMIIAVDLVVKQ